MNTQAHITVQTVVLEIKPKNTPAIEVIIPAGIEAAFTAPGPQGPRGGAGPAGDAGTTSVMLSAAVSALKCVTFSGVLCTPMAADDYAGIALTSGTGGQVISVRRLGLLEDPLWSFTPGLPVFIGAAGAVSQTPPSSAFVRRIGSAVTATRLSLQPFTPIGVL